MPEPRRRIEVAAAVIHDVAGRFLLAQRPPGKAFEGYWEFPGGKVEPGESATAAVCRELHEELGIAVDTNTVFPWLTRDFEYPHAAVRLRFFRIYQWRGEPHGREGQRFAWQTADALSVAPILPANGPILRALELPDVYGITQAATMGIDAFNMKLEAALKRGLRLIQVREKTLRADVLRQFATHVVTLSHRHGARVLINGDVQLARESGADGVHLTAAQLQSLTQRPDCAWVAASCHNRARGSNTNTSRRAATGLARIRALRGGHRYPCLCAGWYANAGLGRRTRGGRARRGYVARRVGLIRSILSICSTINSALARYFR